MEQPTSDKSTIRFLSFSNDKEDAEKEAKLKEAAARIEQAIAKEKSLNELVDCPAPESQEETTIPENDTRSLYERLQQQRNKKKESIEEAQKLSNFVAHLDEDDANYLNEVAKNRREEELRKRLEIQDALEAKKRLDEQKMQEQEKRMKETLLGTCSKDTRNLKPRLFSMIKVKTKPKEKDHSGSKGTRQPNDLQMSESCQAKSMRRTSDAVGQSSEQRASKRLPSESSEKEDTITSHDETQEKITDDFQKQQCNCPKKVTQVLGILPSSLMVKRNPRDSDESDNSDEETNCKLIQRSKRKR